MHLNQWQKPTIHHKSMVETISMDGPHHGQFNVGGALTEFRLFGGCAAKTICQLCADGNWEMNG
jgi:hypothetical protein